MTDHLVSRRAVLHGGVGLAVAGALGVWRAVPAIAVSAPTIYGCSAWGARPSSSPITVLDSRPTKVIVHHTAGANSTDYSQAHAFSLARSIQNYHMDHNGWIDSGQQFTISRGGYIMEGRTVDQRKALSTSIVTRLKKLLPEVPVISMNLIEFEKATYTNRTMI